MTVYSVYRSIICLQTMTDIAALFAHMPTEQNNTARIKRQSVYMTSA